MFKKLTIIIFFGFLFAINANAGSDGELKFKKDQSMEIKDCFEKLNRTTFAFNQNLDKAIIKPIAKGYRNLPDPIQRGTSNAVRNLSTLITIPNNILQGDIKTGFINVARLAVNTTIGLLGTIDVANNGISKICKRRLWPNLRSMGYWSRLLVSSTSPRTINY